MKIILALFLLGHAHVFASSELSSHLFRPDFGGLEKIVKKRYIKVLTTKNAYDYYIYQGQKKGLQYEMVREFTKFLNQKYKSDLDIVFEMIPVEFDQLVPLLDQGIGDLIAVGITPTLEREQSLSFTTPYRIVDEVIITRKELQKENWKDKTFHIQDNSSFYHSLKKLDFKGEIITVDKNYHAGNMLELVSLEKYDYTLVNSFWAKTLIKRYDNLVILKDENLRRKIKIAWATSKKNTKLLKELNEFLPKVKKGTLLGNLFSYKYFYDLGRIQTVDFSLQKSTLSPYDETIKKYAKIYGFDWRLLAAVSYQESRFNQDLINEWGAIGIFQVKQMTANEPYINIKDISGKDNFDNNAHAGIKYLHWIKNRYFDDNTQMKEEDRIRMTLAAYNAGPARLLRAIKKTKELNLNPNVWFRNVERGMLATGHQEPVIYVSEINKHYVSYDQLGIKK